MALDDEYFDAIHIDVVKKKYYNANKVEAVLSDIRAQAAALNAENAALRSKVADLADNKDAIGDVLLSVKKIAAQMLLDAQEQADSIVADAHRDAEDIRLEAQRSMDSSIAHIEACYSRMKRLHLDCVDALNREWQDFLCSQYPEDDADNEIPPEFRQSLMTISAELAEIENEEQYSV